MTINLDFKKENQLSMQHAEKHKKACAIFLDFAKAFDIVNHDILLKIFIFNINKNNDSNKMQIKYFIEKEELEQSDTAKYVGIYFDINLTWNKHIEYINCKLNRGISVLQKIRKFVQEKTFKNFSKENSRGN